MKNVYNEEKLDQIPSDVKQWDDKAIEIFARALKDGFEAVKHIRLMVVGMFGVGKTSLVNNLIKDLRGNNFKPLSTEGIDLHRCQLMDNGDWCLDKEQKSIKNKLRFKRALMEATQPTANIHSTFDAPDGQNITDGVSEEEPVANDTYINNPSESLAAITKNVKEHKDDEGVREFLVPTSQDTNREPDNFQASPTETKKDTTVSVWDFAGQTLYYSTHQFFLNKRSIYLVLMDMTKRLDECVNESVVSGAWCGLDEDCKYSDVLKFWLNAIHMYSGYKSTEENIEPTVILVGTRKDQMQGSDKEKQCDNYFDTALNEFGSSPILKHIHFKKFLVNNMSPEDSIFGELRAEIQQLAQRQDYWGETCPIRWIHMEQSLDKLRDKDKQLLTMEKIEQANKSNVRALDKEELTLFLERQHRHGNVLFFNTDTLKQLVVLAPQWIIDAFKCFITHVPNKDPILRQAWKMYEDLAILKPEVFKDMMDKSPSHVRRNREEVIKYMEYMDVIAKPLKLEEVEEASNLAADQQHVEQESISTNAWVPKFLDFYIVPCQLKKVPPPKAHFTSPEDCKKTPVLCFVFVQSFMPPSYFHRLVAVCIRTWPITKVGGKDQLYNGLAVFDICQTSTLTIWYKYHIIYARVASFSEDIDSKQCQYVRLTIQRILLNFVGQSLENSITHDSFDEYILCPELNEALLNEGIFRSKAFIYYPELKCTACPKSHLVKGKEALRYWYEDRIDTDDDINTKAEGSDVV